MNMAKTPQFFKIILQETIQEAKLRIPKKFVRRYRNYLSERVCLKVPTGAKWQVELVKSGDRIWFGNGWQHFVDYYSLSQGSFLVFQFEDFKNCTFGVLIFDETMSEIDYPFNVEGEQVLHHQPIKQENNDVDVWPTRKSEDKSQLPFSRSCKKMKQENCRTQPHEFHQPITPKSMEIDASRPRKLVEKSTPPFSGPWKKMKHEIGTGLSQAKKGNKLGRFEIKKEMIEIEASPTRSQVEESTTPFSRPCKKMKLENETGLHDAKRGKRDDILKGAHTLTREEKANALNRANSYYKSNNLSFSVVMHPSHVGSDFRVQLPRCANIYFTKQQGKIILNSVDGKTWSIEYVYATQRGHKAARICHGWRKFVEDNHLEVGDVCVFELINQNASELKVVICRQNQDASTSPTIGNKQRLNKSTL